MQQEQDTTYNQGQQTDKVRQKIQKESLKQQDSSTPSYESEPTNSQKHNDDTDRNERSRWAGCIQRWKEFSLQKTVHGGMIKAFAAWGSIIVRYSTLILIFSLVCSTIFSLNVTLYEEYDDVHEVWTPKGSQSIKNRDFSEELFNMEGGQRGATILAIAKPQPNSGKMPNILTREAFKEMITFEQFLLNNVTLAEDYVKFGTDFMDADVSMRRLADDIYIQPTNVQKNFIAVKDLCQLRNITTLKQEKDLFERCDDDCPVQIEQKCTFTSTPLDFIYERHGDLYNLTEYNSDSELIKKIRTGKGDELLYPEFGKSLYIDAIFAQTYPEEVKQNFVTGKNDISTAEAARFILSFDMERVPQVDATWMKHFEVNLQENTQKFSEQSRYVEFLIFTKGGFLQDFGNTIENDLFSFGVSGVLVGGYLIVMLGSCGPVHMRTIPAIICLVCIGISWTLSTSICLTQGFLISGVHNFLPFLLIGIGVDDVFVIVNAVDQTDEKLSPEERIKEGLLHAGPSITITSFTNALSFYFGSFTSLIALNSFCMHAATGIIAMYVTVLTIFTAVLIWDQKRIANDQPDCFSLCCCRETSTCFCRGIFLSKKLREYYNEQNRQQVEEQLSEKNKHKVQILTQNSKLSYDSQKRNGSEKASRKIQLPQPTIKKTKSLAIQSQKANLADLEVLEMVKVAQDVASNDWNKLQKLASKEQNSTEGRESTASTRSTVATKRSKKIYSSATEKFLDQKYSRELLSSQGRASVLTVWAIFICISVFGALNVKTDFKYDFFLEESGYINQYREKSMTLFNPGFVVNLYVDNPDLQIQTEENQLRLINFNDNLQRCKGCQEPWFELNSLDSWFMDYRSWVNEGECYLQREGLDPFKPVIEPKAFNICLQKFLDVTIQGQRARRDLIFSNEPNALDRKITGFRQRLLSKSIPNVAIEGKQFLIDLRSIEKEFGLPGSYSFAPEFLDFEQYFNFTSEALLSTGLSIFSVVLILLFVTSSWQITGLVTLSVLLVDLFLLAGIYYWNLTLNPLVIVNVVIAIGLSVDYSAHIAHSYLINHPKDDSKMSQNEIRRKKTKLAVSKMGSSVFHGGFSTFLAIIVLAPSRSYVFMVFFRLWFIIIVFGMANGFLLLPVILSYMGPTARIEGGEHELSGSSSINESSNSADDSSSREQQIKSQKSEKMLLSLSDQQSIQEEADSLKRIHPRQVIENEQDLEASQNEAYHHYGIGVGDSVDQDISQANMNTSKVGLLRERRKNKFALLSEVDKQINNLNNSNRHQQQLGYQAQFTTHADSVDDIQQTDSLDSKQNGNSGGPSEPLANCRYSQQSSLSSQMLILEESKEEEENEENDNAYPGSVGVNNEESLVESEGRARAKARRARKIQISQVDGTIFEDSSLIQVADSSAIHMAVKSPSRHFQGLDESTIMPPDLIRLPEIVAKQQVDEFIEMEELV